MKITRFFDSAGGADAKTVGLFPGFRGRIRGFSLPGNATMDFTMNEGGRAMQCQKLKTYMETGRENLGVPLEGDRDVGALCGSHQG